MRAGLWLSVLLASVARAGTVSVHMPVGTPCDFAQLRAALRIPPASVTESDAPDAVQLELRRNADAWSLTLTAPGQAPLERAHFAQGDDCVAVFEEAALIVDRYLSGIDWKAEPGEVSVLPPPEPHVPLQLMVEVAGGGEYGVTGVAPEGELSLGLRKGALIAELGGAFLGVGQRTFPTDLTPATIVISQQTWAALAAVGTRLKLGRGWMRIELMGGAEFWSVSAVADVPPKSPSPLPHPGTALRTLPFGGLRLGYMFELTNRLSLGLRLSARIHNQTDFAAGDAHLISHLSDGELTLVLSYLFF